MPGRRSADIREDMEPREDADTRAHGAERGTAAPTPLEMRSLIAAINASRARLEELAARGGLDAPPSGELDDHSEGPAALCADLEALQEALDSVAVLQDALAVCRSEIAAAEARIVDRTRATVAEMETALVEVRATTRHVAAECGRLERTVAALAETVAAGPGIDVVALVNQLGARIATLPDAPLEVLRRVAAIATRLLRHTA